MSESRIFIIPTLEFATRSMLLLLQLPWRIYHRASKKNHSYDNLNEYLNLALQITLANKKDNPTFKEAMISPEAAGFVSAMETEILTLIELDVFEIVPRPQQKVISGVWALKRKRYPFESSRLDTVLVDSNNKKELITLKRSLASSCG